jgi:hypothetical protein
MDVFQEWPLLSDLFGEVEQIPESMHARPGNFLARLQVNSFRTILITFELTPIGYAHIRARENQFQTLGRIGTLKEVDYVTSMRQEFAHTIEPDIEFGPDGVIEQRAHAVRRRITKSDEHENGGAREEEE